MKVFISILFHLERWIVRSYCNICQTSLYKRTVQFILEDLEIDALLNLQPLTQLLIDPELQFKNKWKNSAKNEPGMIVLIKDECVPALQWPLGRIITTHP